jgi:hypothetical protein
MLKSEAASKNTRTPTTTPPPAMPFVTRIEVMFFKRIKI